MDKSKILDTTKDIDVSTPKTNGGQQLWRTVNGVIQALIIAAVCWLTRTIVAHERELAVIHSQQSTSQDRIEKLEGGGSTRLQVHEKDDDRRVIEITKVQDRHESVIAELTKNVAQIPGRLDTLDIRMKGLESGQQRIEAAIQKHLDAKP